jgi:hypothetical protein
MGSVTLSIPDDELDWLKRWADYDGLTIEEALSTWLRWRIPTLPAGSMSITCVVPESELRLWNAEARKRGYTTAEWIRRMGNLVVGTGVAAGLEAPVGVLAMAAMIDQCQWCRADLPGDATIRRRYCSDLCRVAAWRARRKHTGASG